MKYLFLVSVSCLLLTFSCKKPGLFTKDLIKNGNVEAGNNAPEDWQIVEGEYSIGWSGERYRSGAKSLTIQNSDDTTGTSVWILQIDDVSKILKNKKLKLDVWIETEDIGGTGYGESEGVFFSIKGFTGSGSWSYSTLGNQLIVGSQDWTLYSIITDGVVPSNTTDIIITLGMGAFTEGRVWFDDMSLYYVN